jgi:hypothetical protein
MNSIQRKIMLGIIFTALFLPFIGVLFFVRSDYTFELIFLTLVCFGILLVTFIIYLIWEDKIKYKRAVLITVPVIIIIFFAGYGVILEIANQIDFNLIRKNDYITLLDALKEENFKEIYVSRSRDVTRVNEFKYNGEDSVLQKVNISRSKLDLITSKMHEYKIYSITKDNNMIYFTSGGFIDSESGYVYTQSNERPARNHAGKVLTWQRVNDNWYYWYAD